MTIRERLIENRLRRRVLALMIGSAASFAALAQTPVKVWRIGLLEPRTQSASVERVFFEGLRALGYVEGRNLVVQRVFADNDLERLPELAAQLVKSKVDLIVTRGTPAVRAAQRATTTIPILALAFGDPVALGFAKSLARPGGNITGRTLISEEIEGKRLELLVETVPRVTRIAYLINPDNPASIRSASNLETAARKINKELVIVHARGEHEFNAAFAQMIRERAGAVLFALDTVFDDHFQRMGELALQHKLPSMFGVSRAGGYGILSPTGWISV